MNRTVTSAAEDNQIQNPVATALTAPDYVMDFYWIFKPLTLPFSKGSIPSTSFAINEPILVIQEPLKRLGILA